MRAEQQRAMPIALLAQADGVKHDREREEDRRVLGGSLGLAESYLFLRGLKTLALRAEAHCDGAGRVAQALAEHPLVSRVYYPGQSHPEHALATRQMRRYGGMVALELRGWSAQGKQFLDSLTPFTQAVSLGDVESLATHPASTTHQLLPEALRRKQGVTEGLVRLSIGIEDPEELVEELLQALDALAIAEPAAP